MAKDLPAERHTHDAVECYVIAIVCGKLEHEHDPHCRNRQDRLTCPRREHTHVVRCRRKRLKCRK